MKDSIEKAKERRAWSLDNQRYDFDHVLRDRLKKRAFMDYDMPITDKDWLYFTYIMENGTTGECEFHLLHERVRYPDQLREYVKKRWDTIVNKEKQLYRKKRGLT